MTPSLASAARLPAVGGATHRRLDVVRSGALAGVGAGLAMLGWLMFCAEVANEPTSVQGIDSSTWTPVTGIATIVAGHDAFSGSFAVGPILTGLLLHFITAALVAVPGALVIVYTLGGRVTPIPAAALGLTYGLAVQVIGVNVVVNWLQPSSLIYESLPQWGWWVGHAAYGTALGLLLARRLGRVAT